MSSITQPVHPSLEPHIPQPSRPKALAFALVAIFGVLALIGAYAGIMGFWNIGTVTPYVLVAAGTLTMAGGIAGCVLNTMKKVVKTIDDRSLFTEEEFKKAVGSKVLIKYDHGGGNPRMLFGLLKNVTTSLNYGPRPSDPVLEFDIEDHKSTLSASFLREFSYITYP